MPPTKLAVAEKRLGIRGTGGTLFGSLLDESHEEAPATFVSVAMHHCW